MRIAPVVFDIGIVVPDFPAPIDAFDGDLNCFGEPQPQTRERISHN
jgi:hypothetical protein